MLPEENSTLEKTEMKSLCLPIMLLAVVVFAAPRSFGADARESEAEAKKPADRIVVMYFHRTERCPTCLRMGSYSEEAVLKGFEKAVEEGTVEFHYVDFQNRKNAAITSGYKVAGPSLIVVKVVGDKVVRVENLKDIWIKNRDKDVFLKYVRDHVAAMRKTEAKTAILPDQAARER